MKKQLQIFLAGVLVVVPFSITIWAIVAIGRWLDSLVTAPLAKYGINLFPGVGALILVVSIYFVGLLTHLWAFRWLLSLVERLVVSVPGVKTIYESVRDLLKLFGGNARRMGRVVLYRPPGTGPAMLGILTNERPPGARSPGEVAVYFPLSYMLGGPLMYVSAEHLQDVDMTVEKALKLCATAQVGGEGRPAAAPQDTAGTGKGEDLQSEG